MVAARTQIKISSSIIIYLGFVSKSLKNRLIYQGAKQSKSCSISIRLNGMQCQKCLLSKEKFSIQPTKANNGNVKLMKDLIYKLKLNTFSLFSLQEHLVRRTLYDFAEYVFQNYCNSISKTIYRKLKLKCRPFRSSKLGDNIPEMLVPKLFCLSLAIAQKFFLHT